MASSAPVSLTVVEFALLETLLASPGRVFERFFTTERDRGGTGLGLAIVKAIAEARGGTVSASFDAR